MLSHFSMSVFSTIEVPIFTVFFMLVALVPILTLKVHITIITLHFHYAKIKNFKKRSCFEIFECASVKYATEYGF